MDMAEPHRHLRLRLVRRQGERDAGRADDIHVLACGGAVETGGKRIVAALVAGHFRPQPDRAIFARGRAAMGGGGNGLPERAVFL